MKKISLITNICKMKTVFTAVGHILDTAVRCKNWKCLFVMQLPIFSTPYLVVPT